jgi:hypothetical protein
MMTEKQSTILPPVDQKLENFKAPLGSNIVPVRRMSNHRRTITYTKVSISFAADIESACPRFRFRRSVLGVIITHYAAFEESLGRRIAGLVRETYPSRQHELKSPH